LKAFLILEFRFWIVPVLLGLCGCQPAALAIYKIRGPDFIDPVYVLEKEPTVVIVENYQQSGAMAEAERIAHFVEQDLKSADKEAVVPIVETEKVYDLRGREPIKYQKMKIGEIGKAVGAKQVIYVDLLGSGVQQMLGSDIMRGAASGRVKVIDSETGATLWPVEATQGYPVQAETPIRRPSDKATPMTVREETCEKFGTTIGRLFHKWQPEG
jgi:hypothetical protein